MAKRIISLLLVVVMVFLYYAPLAYALDATDSAEITGYLLEEARVNTINNLYAERAKLAVNMGENMDAIIRIDYQLETLGVEEILFSEIAQKIGGRPASPDATVPATNQYTKWTSYRTIYVYNGTQYEIQDVKGISRSKELDGAVFDPTLYPLTASYTTGVSAMPGIDVLAKEAFRIVLEQVGEKIIEVTLDAIEEANTTAGYVSKGIYEFLSFCEETSEVIEEELSPTVDLSDISYSFTLGMCATESYLLVKMPGYVDEGHQIYAYAGNEIECVATCEVYKYKSESGVPVRFSADESYQYTVSSPYYDVRYQKAVTNFVAHKQGYAITQTHFTGSIDVELLRDINSTDANPGSVITETYAVPKDREMFYYCMQVGDSQS